MITKKGTLLALMTFLLSFGATNAQTTFQKRYTGAGFSFPGHLHESSNGDLVVSGHSDSFSSSMSGYLMVLDSLGNLQWANQYGGTGTEHINYVYEMADGSYLTAGWSDSFSSNEDAWVMHVDVTGAVLWSKVYGGAGEDRVRFILDDGAGAFYLLGHTTSIGSGIEDILLMKIDSSGNVIWDKSYGGPLEDRGRAMTWSHDGNLVLTGWTDGFGAGRKDAILMKVDTAGSIIWQKVCGEANAERGQDVILTSDNGFMISGFRKRIGAPFNDPMLIKTDASGSVQWLKLYESAAEGTFRGVLETSDGGYFAYGDLSIAPAVDSHSVYILRTDNTGSPAWAKEIGSTGDEGYPDAVENADGGFTLIAHTSSFRADSLHDPYLVRTDSEGSSLCNSTVHNFTALDTMPLVANTSYAISSGLTTNNFSVSPIPATFGTDTLCEGLITSNDEVSMSRFEIYPNPVKDVLKIEQTGGSGNVKVEVFDLYGRLLHLQDGGNVSSVDMTDYPSGTYVVRVTSGGHHLTRKVIKH